MQKSLNGNSQKTEPLLLEGDGFINQNTITDSAIILTLVYAKGNSNRIMFYLSNHKLQGEEGIQFVVHHSQRYAEFKIRASRRIDEARQLPSSKQ